MNVNQKPKIHTLGQQEMEEDAAQSGFWWHGHQQKAKLLNLFLE